MVNAFFYSNIAVATTLSGNINNSVTTATVASTVGWPTSYPFIVALDYGAATEELVQVTNNAAGTLTIVRGYGGTGAVSHSTGAVVRHVYNAQDATDFRTHEAATSDVHGVTGALVGATMAQTLTNKTLTSPTINAGALSGTFTGSPTLSGTPLFTGAPAFRGATTTTAVLTARVTGFANDTFTISAGGGIDWGGGGGATDTNLYRTAANTLKTDDALVVVGEIQPQNLVRATRANATDSQYESRVTGDSVARWFTQADGKHFWGSGSAAVDTTLYRSAADTLKTDDAFVVGDTLTVTNTTWSSYTPAVGGSGTVAFSTRIGYYTKIGKIVYVVAFFQVSTAGSGTGNVTIDMPSNVDRTARQVLGASSDNLGLNGHSHLVFFTGGSGATGDRLRSYDGQNMIGSDWSLNGLLTIQGWYREA